MKNRILIISLIIPWLCLLAWALALTHTRASGTDVTVAIAGYDPRDLLSGRYIAYQIDWSQTDCTVFPNKVCPKNEFCKEARWGRQCRFYVPETHADRLDKLFRQRGEKLRFTVVYSYAPHKTPIAKELLINGKPWQTYLTENPQ